MTLYFDTYIEQYLPGINFLMKHHFTLLSSLQPVDVWDCTEQHLFNKKSLTTELGTFKLQWKLKVYEYTASSLTGFFFPHPACRDLASVT